MAAEMSREGRVLNRWPSPGEDACGNCRFFAYSRGECHRHAPTAERPYGNWPVVDYGSWCGDHERAPVAAAIAEGWDG
jgi:hypothetical protein